MTIHAKVMEYKGVLVCELVAEKSIEGEVHCSLDNPGVFGQIIMNTGRHLGVSKEAFAILQSLKPGQSSLGEIDWFTSADSDCFGWIGGPYALLDPKSIEPSRQYQVGAFVEIKNDVPEGAKDAIDNAEEE